MDGVFARRMTADDHGETEADGGSAAAVPGGAGGVGLGSAAFEALLELGRARGQVTRDELDAALPPDRVTAGEIDDAIGLLGEIGIELIEAAGDAADEDDLGPSGAAARLAAEEAAAEDGAESSPAAAGTAGATGNLGAAASRSDDPVRMFLREMGDTALLTREDEIAVAQRIEAGRETMLAALCESPTTFAALAAWRDAVEAGRLPLRDLIELEVAAAAGGGAEPSPAAGPPARPGSARSPSACSSVQTARLEAKGLARKRAPGTARPSSSRAKRPEA